MTTSGWDSVVGLPTIAPHHFERMFIGGLLTFVVGLWMLPTAYLYPDYELDEYSAAIVVILLISFGSSFIFFGAVVCVVGLAKAPGAFKKYFGLGSHRNDILYMIYSFVLFAWWLYFACMTAGAYLPVWQRSGNVAEGIVALVFFSTSFIWLAAFAFFAYRALQRSDDGYLRAGFLDIDQAQVE